MGGDHKCPLCEATFTRPQHVGRHLRAHTGDRPYECKECPLRFARSDLLSRHVNKAHKHADEGDPGPKKGRRKSMPTLAVKQQPGEGSDAARARKASFNQGQQPHLQAQSMYPHHPLLAGAPGQGWTSNGTAGLNGMTPPHFSNVFSSTALPGAAGNPMYANGFPPQFAVPQMGGTGSNQVMGSSSMGRGPSLGSLSSMGYEFGFKKRACDQCNHSKVRCDFSDPCLRCAQRNIPCTYNKPQKSRSNANISNQRISQAMSASGSRTPTSLSGSSLSPQSHFSSPSQSVNSPITAMASPNIPYPQRPSSMVALPRQHVCLDSGQSMPYPAVNNAAWSNSFASGLAEPSLTAGQWQQPPTGRPPANPSFDPALPLLHSSPLAGTSSSVYEYSSPTQIPTQIPLPQSYNPLSMRQRGSNLSSASPQQNLAPTPSLSSHGTSPSSTDEPAERRTSQFSISSGVWQDRTNGKPIDPNRSFVSDLNHAMPITYSPAQMHNTLALNAACQSDPSANSTFAWPGSGVPLDPSLQFRQSFASDDEEATRPPSSAASVYGDFGESTFRAIQHRRRSSASLWATAFNQMTLQDGSKVPMAPSMMNPFDPYTAGQVSQQIHQKRPGFPMFTAPEGTSSKVPSLADVKDLWKLFMSEPMPGQTPGAFGEKNNEFESISPELMPQPELGHRTLSKSNSMPDLTSPSMYGPAFFSTYRNGTTPRPGEPQQSYMPTHQPEDHAHQAADDPILRKWKNEIQQRQATFNMMPGGKMGKSPQTDTMLPPNYLHLSDRPMASVLQHASALQQTLAPERTPSFGQQDQSSSSLHPHSFAKTPSKLSSAMARPGNKRLASQTLGPDQQKKGSFDLWNEANDGPLADAEDEGGLQNQPEWKTAGGEASFPADSGMPPGGGYSNANMGPQQIVPGPQHTNRMFFSTWPPVGASQAMRMGMAGMNELRRGG